MELHGFGRNAGPSAPRTSQFSFPNSHPNPSPPRTNLFSDKGQFPAAQMNRPQQPPQQQWQVSPRGQGYSVPSPTFASQLNEPVKLGYHTNQDRLSPGAAYVTASQGEAKFPSQYFNYHVPGRTRSPPLPSHGTANLEQYYPTADHGRPGISPPRVANQWRTPVQNANSSPQERFDMVDYSDIYDAQVDDSTLHSYSKQPKISEDRVTSQRKPPVLFANSSPQERFKMVDYSDIYDAGVDASPLHSLSKQPKRGDEGVASQNKSPVQYANSSPQERIKMVDYSDIYDAGVDASPMHSISKQLKRGEEGVSSQRKSPIQYPDSSPQERSEMVDYSDIRHAGTEGSPMRSHSKQPKRARSPRPPSAVLLGSSSVQLDSEREMQAKARRLARFNVELSEPTENLLDAKHKTSENRLSQPSLGKVGADKPAEARDSSNRVNLFEIDNLQSSSVVVGLCPDMCPESERQERERKGDLDKYERLDGDRNQTSKYLAVKKYNRTAEREADLIRPMPVLQKTVDYLLTLLNQPYNEDFLSIYNFLWDRMRAIRMDLRMQHIFNHQAIIMLEQMIRLHIVAMHELCEYNKGEGFSEGFDAHLNIEQMNKTSVELFQMYDDHRKKGINVPTEREFRGYYALLKLDKHPGYKVEPAELSLDLAKMTPEIRGSPEILFARGVARACGIGNFIAFFRLARKATYLQACLMHAHFAKLRTQAFASLHGSLQNNQGIPVTHVVSWLGLEEEDVESLLEYHGFALKQFEEIYMVKEGPFLNSDMDFTTKRSQLVHLKKSQTIIDDIYSDPKISQITEEPETVPNELDMVDQRADASEADTWTTASKDVIHVYQANTALRAVAPSEKPLEVQTLPFLNRETDVKAAEVFLPHSISSVDHYINNHAQQNEDEHMIESEGDASADNKILPDLEVNMAGALATVSSPFKNVVINSSAPQMDMDRELDNEVVLVTYQRNEIADEKLRLIVRKWKQQATRREAREQRIMLANAALSSLSLGPPLRQVECPPRFADCELNIDHAARERYGKQGKSWSRFNVSELVAPVLCSRNPNAKCLCWKLLLLVPPLPKEGQTNCVTSRWLLSKVMGSNKENDRPIVSLSHLSVWRSWISTDLNPFYKCCLSIVREAMFDNNNLISEDFVTGASAVVFLVSESISWEIQRMRLHSVLTSIPSGSNLPLLIISGDAYNEESTDPSLAIIKRLGLQDANMMRIHSFSVVFLCGNYSQDSSTGFFMDDKLKEGLLWLANHSPLQPPISLMKTREVFLSYLRSSAEVLENGDASCFGPNHFISIFNSALDRLVEEILAAATMNVNHWPSPEIDLLEKSSNEGVFVDKFLPSIGWSSSVRIQPLIRGIRGCKLPEFSNDISWLKQGSHMGLKISDQKLALEECLVSYMTQCCRMLNADLAVREARIMVQVGADLELRGSCYYIIPKWSKIFRRIQNWRLMNLSTGVCSAAYLLASHLDRFSSIDHDHSAGAATPSTSSITLQDSDKNIDSECHRPTHPFPTRLSFDEIVEISCNVLLPERPKPLPEPLSSSPVVHGPGDSPTTHILAKDKNEDPKCSPSGPGGNKTLAVPLSKMDDRLTMLLERCTRLQDSIDEKLAVYF